MGVHPDTVWIVKPGENSNRGAGITLCEDATELDKFIRLVSGAGNSKKLIEHNCEADSSRSLRKHQ